MFYWGVEYQESDMGETPSIIRDYIDRMLAQQATEDELGVVQAFLNGDPYYERVNPNGTITRYEIITQPMLEEAQAKAWDEGAAHVYEGTAVKCDYTKDGIPCPDNPYRNGADRG